MVTRMSRRSMNFRLDKVRTIFKKGSWLVPAMAGPRTATLSAFMKIRNILIRI
ncbi:hypothetical protein D3C75_1206100 [compost metagenome]